MISNYLFKKFTFFKYFYFFTYSLFFLGLLSTTACKQKIVDKNEPVIISQNSNTDYQEAIELEDTLPDDDDIVKAEPKQIEKPRPISKPKPKPKKREELISTEIIQNYKTARPKKRAKDPNRPILKFDKLEHNFGYIDEGEIITHDFFFTNVGRTPAIISEATTSCGCTVPSFPKYPIMPGQREKITVVFDSKGRLLKQNKSITITANTDPNYTTMYLTGEVWRKPKR